MNEVNDVKRIVSCPSTLPESNHGILQKVKCDCGEPLLTDDRIVWCRFHGLKGNVCGPCGGAARDRSDGRKKCMRCGGKGYCN